MKTIAAIALLLCVPLAAGAQTMPSAPTAVRPVPSIHHAVSSNPQAQAAFDRGLLDLYAYNPEAAEHEFYTAADLDTHLAMAYWGIALSNAPNLNVPPTDDRNKQARYAIGHAVDLERYAPAEDKALIDAAAARFNDTTKAKPDALLLSYRDALGAIAAAHPDDPDAAALYAESALYVAVGDSHNGFDKQTPAQRAAFRARIAAVLPIFQNGLAKFPTHVGLLHFYIHAAQMAGQSQLAVDAAKQLLAFQFPAADSHLTHMPGHTFFDVGMYDEALDAGERSIAMDAADVACCHPGFYSATRFYHHHNVSFVLYAMTQTGQTARAVDVARAENDDALIARQLVAARRWNDVVAMPYDKKTSSAPETFARGVAYAELGNTAQAQQMLANLPADPTDSPSSAATLQAMKLTLRAQIAEANHDDAEALELLTQASAAAAAGNKLGAVEIPSLYYFSPHMALAELAMRDGKLDVARQALQAELEASPRSKVALSALAQLKQ